MQPPPRAEQSSSRASPQLRSAPTPNLSLSRASLYDRGVRRLVLALMCSCFAVQGASAQPGVEDVPRTSYQGVVPGRNNPPPRAGRAGRARARNAHLITWPGFEMQRDGSSRFFIQTDGPVETEQLVENDGNRVVLVLKNTRVHLSNTFRSLETEFFNTPVRRARIERRGRHLALVLEMRANVQPFVTTEPAAQEGYQFTFLTFPAGDYLPVEEAVDVQQQQPAQPEPVEQPPSVTSP